MNFEEAFYSIWNSVNGLEIPEPTDNTICVYALCFQKWIDQLASEMENPNAVLINQTKILLTDRFFDWERAVPLSHRQRQGIHGHTCIYQVFKKAYEHLRIIELTLTPPPLYLPPQPPPPLRKLKLPNIAGLFIGENAESEDDDSDSK